MAIQQYASPQTQRIGLIKGETLAHAIPIEALGIAGKQFDISRNAGDTVIYRRWLPRGATNGTAASINRITADPNAHLTVEGVTPTPDTLIAQDITVTLRQYSCLYMYTDKMAEMYEDNIPDEIKIQTGERMGLVREMIRYGALKACTNKFYVGGSSRSAVNGPITLPILRKVSRSILGNRGKMVTQILAPSANFNTSAVEAAMLVFHHTDCENDVRNIEGFKEVASYGSRKPAHAMEVGSSDRYRFIGSPELAPITDAGATAAGTGMLTSGTKVDVYPMVVVAADAFGDVALRGMRSFDITHLPHSKPDKSDPLGQRGYMGASFWSAMFVQNDGWMAVVEVGVTDL